MSERERLYLFDTTLRDGAQTQGVDFSVEDKTLIATALDKIGVDYVEGGWPGANPTDTAFFGSPPPFSHATFTAFGMTRASGPQRRKRSRSRGFVRCRHEGDLPRRQELGFSGQGRARRSRSTRKSGADPRQHLGDRPARQARAMLDAEHFFDGYKANPEYALKCLKAAHEAGARWVVLCDTNGGTMPDEVERIVGEVTKVMPGNQPRHPHP